MGRLDLKQWTVHFVKNKDVFERRLESYEEKGDVIVFKFKDKQVAYFVQDFLDAACLDFCKGKGLKAIVCKAKRNNLAFLVKSWSLFKEVQDLTIIFADVDINKRLIIKPILHHLFCDELTLKTGLDSLFQHAFR